jgi:hypothetical protein
MSGGGEINSLYSIELRINGGCNPLMSFFFLKKREDYPQLQFVHPQHSAMIHRSRLTVSLLFKSIIIFFSL